MPRSIFNAIIFFLIFLIVLLLVLIVRRAKVLYKELNGIIDSEQEDCCQDTEILGMDEQELIKFVKHLMSRNNSDSPIEFEKRVIAEGVPSDLANDIIEKCHFCWHTNAWVKATGIIKSQGIDKSSVLNMLHTYGFPEESIKYVESNFRLNRNDSRN